MTLSWKQLTRRVSLGLSCSLLVLLLAACGGPGSSAPTSTSTFTPAPQSITPTPTPPLSGTLAIYAGTSFTIGYATSWTKRVSGDTVIFQDAQGLNKLGIILIPNPEGRESAATLAPQSLAVLEQAGNIKNPQPANLSTTTAVGGDTWVQKGITGDVSKNGVEVPGELVLLVDNHPANAPTTQIYEIYYGGPSVTFSTINATIFQPMLQSFKFVV